MMQFAVKRGMIKDGPTAGIKNVKVKTDGFRIWDENDIAAFETRHPDRHQGTAGGSPISPLLANIYMRRFVLGWKKLGLVPGIRAE
jgi:hypothetical protein